MRALPKRYEQRYRWTRLIRDRSIYQYFFVNSALTGQWTKEGITEEEPGHGFFHPIHGAECGPGWHSLDAPTAAQSSITGATLVPLVGHAAADFTVRTWDTPSSQTITLSTLKNRAGQPALRSRR